MKASSFVVEYSKDTTPVNQPESIYGNPLPPEEWKKWVKKHANLHDNLRKAQLKMTKKYGYMGIAILGGDLTRMLGTLILPEIHTKVSENYTTTKGVKILAQAPTWEEAFKQIGEDW